uniref:Solute carrier family 43 member 3b n=1 Tax=Poecilia latipinna TaxID=48699 RepID=A0A3B3U1E1_9TELE
WFGCNKLSVRHCLTFVTGLVECLCFAGAVFGWASLAFVLKVDGYFSSLCFNTTGVNDTQILDCSAQDEQLSLIFTITSFMNNFLMLLNGFLFDHFGTTVARLLATCCVSFLSSSPFPPALPFLLFPALPLLAVGGILFLITNMQVGNLFGSRRSTIINIYNGAFDSSSALFLIIKLLHESGVSLHAAFLFLSACSVVHVLRTFFLLPRTFIPHPLPDRYAYGCEQTTWFVKSVFGFIECLSLSEKTFRECLLSRFFVGHLLWLSVMQLRHFLFIGTLNPMLLRLTEGDSSLVSRYTNAFAFTQLCAVLCAPWNGLIMDRHRGKPRAAGETEQEADLRASVLSLFLTALQCVLFSLCASVPSLPLQYLTFILQVLNRSFLFGGIAAFISVAFPSCHFGKLYGLGMSLAALFCLLQYPCFALVNGALGGDPLYLNISLTLLSLLAFIHPLSVYLHCQKLASLRDKRKNTDFSS